MTRLSGEASGGKGLPPGGLPEVLDERYQVLRLLGRGGQGDVYLAHDRNLDIDVAIKVLKSEQRDQLIERFTHEARLIARLDSPNIVHIYDFNPRYPYIVMEYCGDGDLNQLIKSRRPLELPRCVTLLRQICSALTTAHERDNPILHRDLKPGNVLFKNNVPKVADFGLAKVVGDASSGMTHTRGMLGTFGYSSPEQLNDASRVDHRTDLWAVGVIAYELLTFRPPFKAPGDGVGHVVNKVCTKEPETPPFLPEPLWRFVRRSLEKEPDKRYHSAREMVQALEQAVALIPDSAHMRFPPDDALDEVDRMASEVAESFSSGTTTRARELLQAMRRISPDDSVVPYWERRLEEDAVRSDSGSRQGVVSSDSRHRAIEDLIAARDYAGARRECGRLLVESPGDARAAELRQRITSEELTFNRRLDEVRRQAELARTAGDLHKALELWQRFDEQLPGHPDVRAEIAFTKSELEALTRQEHRARAERDAASLVAPGDLPGALRVWDDYLREHPGDAEAAAQRTAIDREWTAKQRQERRQALWTEGSKLRGEGRQEAALAVFESWLAEQPGDEQFVKAAETLRVEIGDRRLAALIEATRREAGELRLREDLDGASRLWQAVLRDHPSRPEATAEVAALEAEIERRDKGALAGEVGELLRRQEAALASGRYASLGRAGKAVETALSTGRQNLDGGLPALRTARQALLDAGAVAERTLAEQLVTARAELREHLARAHDLLETEETGGGATDAERALDEAWKAAVGELATASAPATPGDPLAGLAAAGDRLRAAAAALEAQRGEAVRQGLALAERALGRAEAAVDALRATTASGGDTTDLVALDSRLAALRTEIGARSAGRLLRAASGAALVSAVADTKRIAALGRLHGQLGERVEQALEIAPASSGERLPALLRAAAALLDPQADEAPAPAALVSAGEDLEREIALQRELQGKAAERARERWAKLAHAEAPSGDASRFDEIRRAGTAALEASRFEEAERHATRLESLNRRGRVEAIWNAKRPAVRRLEGPADDDGVVVGPADGASQDLLASYRQALARVDVERLSDLDGRLGEVGEETAGSETGELPIIGRRARKLNARLRADLLARFDKEVADHEHAAGGRRHADSARLAAAIERSHAMLLQPKPAWQVVAPLLALVVVAGLAWGALRPGGGPAEVRLVSPEGATAVRSLTRDGVARTPPTSEITEAGVAWQLEAGRYELTLDSGVRLQFEVPDDRSVLVPGPAVDPADLLRELGLDGP